MALIHFVDTTIEMTTICVNDESILNIVAIVLWLPDSMEGNSIKLINRTCLAWS